MWSFMPEYIWEIDASGWFYYEEINCVFDNLAVPLLFL